MDVAELSPERTLHEDLETAQELMSNFDFAPTDTVTINQLENQIPEFEEAYTMTRRHGRAIMTATIGRAIDNILRSSVVKPLPWLEQFADMGNAYLLPLSDPHANARYRDECPICFDDMDDQTNAVVIVACGHAYHRRCLFSWLALSVPVGTCPMDRKQLCITSPHERGNGRPQERTQGYHQRPRDRPTHVLITGEHAAPGRYIRRRAHQNPALVDLQERMAQSAYRNRHLEWRNVAEIGRQMNDSTITQAPTSHAEQTADEDEASESHTTPTDTERTFAPPQSLFFNDAGRISSSRLYDPIQSTQRPRHTSSFSPDVG